MATLRPTRWPRPAYPRGSDPLPGDRLLVDAEALAFSADGMARVEGRTVLVPHLIPGERAEVEVVDVPPYGAVRARLIRLVTRSALRVDPACAFYDRCPGCHLRHVPYAEELEFKRATLADAAGGLATPEAVRPAPGRDGYRTRVAARVALGRLVMLARHPATAPLPVDGCPVLSPALRRAAAAWPETRSPLPGSDDLVRLGSAAAGWTPPSPAMGAVAAGLAAELLGGGDRLLEVGCGTGGLTLRVASGFSRVVGLDVDPDALSQARARIEAAGLADRVELRAGRIEKVWRRLLVRSGSFEAALVNPMRRPLGRRAMEALVALGVRRLVYVGPSPRPTCRDLAALDNAGLATQRLVPVDLYPGTYHVLTLALVGLPGVW